MKDKKMKLFYDTVSVTKLMRNLRRRLRKRRGKMRRSRSSSKVSHTPLLIRSMLCLKEWRHILIISVATKTCPRKRGATALGEIWALSRHWYWRGSAGWLRFLCARPFTAVACSGVYADAALVPSYARAISQHFPCPCNSLGLTDITHV